MDTEAPVADGRETRCVNCRGALSIADRQLGVLLGLGDLAQQFSCFCSECDMRPHRPATAAQPWESVKRAA